MKVFQHLDELKDSDGVGNDAIGLSFIFQNLGFESHFITRIPRTGKHLANVQFHTIEKFNIPSTVDDLHILHYGGTGYPTHLFFSLFGKKILRFHNITPAKYYYKTTTPEVYEAMLKFESLSYLELESFSIYCDALWCDSDYNFSVVEDMNFRNPSIFPICKKYQLFESKSFGPSLREGSLVFVGRYSPQKSWEDLIDFFELWVHRFPDAKCYCIGSKIGAFDGYFNLLNQKVRSKGLEEKVLFLQGKTDEEVLSLIQKADAFISMSEHEGFCLPILEAFGMGIPVFAFSQGAVPQTMNGGGLLFQNKNFSLLTNDIKEVLLSSNLRIKMITNQYNALEYYNSFIWENKIKENLEKIYS